MRVMRLNDFWTACQVLAQFMASAFKLSSPLASNHYPFSFEPSSPELWIVIQFALNRYPLNFGSSPHGSFLSSMTNPWGEGGN